MITLLAIVLVLIGAVRGATRGTVRSSLDLVGLLMGIPIAFRLGGAVGDRLFSGFAPVFGRTLGSIAVLALLTALIDLIGRRLQPSAQDTDIVDRIGGIAFGTLRGVTFSLLAVVIAAGAPGGTSLGRMVNDSVIAGYVGEPDGWVLRAFEAATGDTQLTQVIAFNRQFPDGPVPSEGFRVLPPTAAADLEIDQQAGVEITLLVNEARAAAGLAALDWSSALSAVAADYAIEMATLGFFSHDSPSSGDVADRLGNAGIDYRIAGENLALAPTVERVHDGLMNSPGHRANILGADYRNLGIGVVRGPLGLMVVQVFHR